MRGRRQSQGERVRTVSSSVQEVLKDYATFHDIYKYFPSYFFKVADYLVYISIFFLIFNTNIH